MKQQLDNLYTNFVNKGAIKRLAKAMDGEATKNVKFVRTSEKWLTIINPIREASGQKPLNDRQARAYIGAINKLSKHVGPDKYFKTNYEAAQAAYELLTNTNIEVFAGNLSPGREDSKNTIVAGKTGKGNTTKSIAIADAPDGGTSLKDITPRQDRTIKNLRQKTEDLISNSSVGARKSPTSASNDVSLPGMRAIDARRVVNSTIISQTHRGVKRAKPRKQGS